MHKFGTALGALAAAAAAVSSASAAADLNEVAALLFFPAVLTETSPGSGVDVETYLTLTNSAEQPIVANVIFIGATDCLPCRLDVPIAAEGTTRVAVFRQGAATVIRDVRSNLQTTCAERNGFAAVSVSNLLGNVVTDNVLFGEQTVIETEVAGPAFSLRPIAIQGLDGGNGDFSFEMNDVEYRRLPRIVALEFLAPNAVGWAPAPYDAFAVMFTPNFTASSPLPLTDCSVTAFDAAGNPFSRTFQFACWTFLELEDLSPEFGYPNLGASPCTGGVNCPENGWMALDCEVDRTNDGSFDALGTVHGALVQRAPAGTVLRRNMSGPSLSAAGSWSRVAVQSVTVGGSATLDLEP